MKTKEKVFEEVAAMLHQQKLSVVKIDACRPWGGFYVIDEKQASRFMEIFFSRGRKNTN